MSGRDGLAIPGPIEHDGDRGGEQKGWVNKRREQPHGDDRTEATEDLISAPLRDTAAPPDHR